MMLALIFDFDRLGRRERGGIAAACGEAINEGSCVIVIVVAMSSLEGLD